MNEIAGSKKRTRAGVAQPPLSASDALDMLVSAIGYCRQAGLTVKAGNRGDGLVIQVAGVARTDSDGTLTLELRDDEQD